MYVSVRKTPAVTHISVRFLEVDVLVVLRDWHDTLDSRYRDDA